ncbi:hypothetical protein EVAR_21005_1 [Eumeta japonica]|uniref:Uncharacterized protein n=1 Tax=Eumeta variegata TaxID=151549 RepID=A0A4C1V765_EUMVA|nr:hypothetical protein EVAR_21005_1 [Eumeta japonica]
MIMMSTKETDSITEAGHSIGERVQRTEYPPTLELQVARKNREQNWIRNIKSGSNRDRKRDRDQDQCEVSLFTTEGISFHNVLELQVLHADPMSRAVNKRHQRNDSVHDRQLNAFSGT